MITKYRKPILATLVVLLVVAVTVSVVEAGIWLTLAGVAAGLVGGAVIAFLPASKRKDHR